MSTRADFWINVILFEVVWILAVGGAARGAWWAGPVAVAVFAAYQLSRRRGRESELVLIALALVIGFVADTFLASTGRIVYAAAVPSATFAPAWILALWVNLALTINHSMAFLQRRLAFAVLFGALGAPVSYLFAAYTWHAVTLAEPLAETLVVLAVLWAVAMPLLCWTARALAARAALRSASTAAQAAP